MPVVPVVLRQMQQRVPSVGVGCCAAQVLMGLLILNL